MKIAIVSRVVFLSGVSTHIKELIINLLARGNDVTLITSGPESLNIPENIELYDSILATGVKVIKVNFPQNPKNKIDYVFKYIKSLHPLKKILNKEQFDVIHLHTPSLSLLFKLLGYKFIRTNHCYGINLGLLSCKATHEIAISKETYLESKLKYSYSEAEISLIYNGVSKQFAEKANSKTVSLLKTEYNIPSDKLIIGLVGTIDFRKGHDVLINAFSLLPNELKNKCHLIFLGECPSKNGSWFESLMKTSSSVGAKVTHIEFSKPKPVYDMIDICVLPSRREGFGLVVVEAMMSNCLMIRSDTEGASEQIINEENGYIFQNENIIQLKDILERVISNFEKQQSVIKAGRIFALEKFTSDVMTTKTIQAYQKVINKYG